MFQVGLPFYLGLNSGRSVSINVNKTRKHFSRNIHGARMFPQCFLVSPTGNIVSMVSFCSQHANYAYATRQGILTKFRACEHLSNFCEQSEQRPNFASTFKLDGTIRYPSIALIGFNGLGRSVTPTFQKQILFTINSTLSKNEQKINVGS